MLAPEQSIPEDAAASVVEPFEASYTGYQWMTSRNWVVHHFSWETVGNEDTTHLHDILDVTTHNFAIDGVEIPDPDRYRGAVVETPDGTHEVVWEFPTRPRPVGTHEFSVELTFDSPIRSQQSVGEETVWEGTYKHEGVYEVQTP